MLSEPWLALHNLACLNRAYEEGRREKRLQEENTEHLRRREDEGKEDEERRESTVHAGEFRGAGDLLRVSQSLLSLTEVRSSSQVTFSRLLSKTGQKRISVEKLPIVCPSPQSHLRRNTLPSVTVAPPLLHLPPLVDQSDSRRQLPAWVSLSKSKSMAFLPHPPSSSTSRASTRASPLPPLALSSSVSSLVAPPPSSSSRRSLRRHSVQLVHSRGEHVNHFSF
ncbi:uncharacterized protein LOC131444848 [Solea solea]|uniref:uncharacterized protein LOC131444848 n=1 Tax=Solea solea TaxID=90069 RepID=UPI00272BED0B|nr:uncharacterized protein LOC131444848 [Solea solea]